MIVLLEAVKLWWKPLLAAFVVAGAATYVIRLRDTITDQQRQIATLKVENEIVKANNAVLTASIQASNQAIDKLADGAKTTQQAFVSLSSNVKGQLQGLDKRLQQISVETKPATCEDTIKYLIDAAKGYQ